MQTLCHKFCYRLFFIQCHPIATIPISFLCWLLTHIMGIDLLNSTFKPVNFFFVFFVFFVALFIFYYIQVVRSEKKYNFLWKYTITDAEATCTLNYIKIPLKSLSSFGKATETQSFRHSLRQPVVSRSVAQFGIQLDSAYVEFNQHQPTPLSIYAKEKRKKRKEKKRKENCLAFMSLWFLSFISLYPSSIARLKHGCCSQIYFYLKNLWFVYDDWHRSMEWRKK